MELMDGVKILATVPTMSWLQSVLIAIGLLGGVVSFSWFITTVIDCDIAPKWKKVSAIMTLLFMSMLIVGGASTVEHPYYEQKVTISEEVDLEEFQKNYRITNQDGDIYTIIDRSQPLL